MKINFTKKEYRLLLDLAYLGDWMINSAKSGPEVDEGPHAKLLQKVYQHANEFACEALIKHDDDYDFYSETRAFEDASQDFIDTYDDNNFWEELLSRLAERDFNREWYKSHDQAPDFREKIEGLHAREVFWIDEFERYGLQRLVADQSIIIHAYEQDK